MSKKDKYDVSKKSKSGVVIFILVVLLIFFAFGIFIFVMKMSYDENTNILDLLLNRTGFSQNESSSVGRSIDETEMDEESTEEDGYLDYVADELSFDKRDFSKLDLNKTLIDESNKYAVSFKGIDNLNQISVENGKMSVYTQPFDDKAPILKLQYKTRLNTYETSLVYRDSVKSFYDRQVDDGVMTAIRVTNVENFAMNGYQVYWFSSEYIETTAKFQYVGYDFFITMPDQKTTLLMNVSAVASSGQSNNLTQEIAFDCLRALSLYVNAGEVS